MLDNPPRTLHVQVSERSWKPIPGASIADPGSAPWFEEVLAIAADFIGVILLVVLGGVIYVFNHLVFKSRAPRPGKTHDAGKKGKRK